MVGSGSVLHLRAEGEDVVIDLDWDTMPDTLGALAACAPARVDLHCAKIAGDQLIFGLPFIRPLENPRSINTIGPGAFLYFPDRQFLEVMYGELQDEEAQVSVLGRVRGPLDGARRLGERLQTSHGWRILWAEVSVTGEPPAELRSAPPSAASPALATMRAAREAMRAAPPEELVRLPGRRGVMLPFGPLAFAESGARTLHENLWTVRTKSVPGSDGDGARMAALLIGAAAQRLVGFCGLEEIGGCLARAATALGTNPPDAPSLLDEVILYTGRLAGWLDLTLPWQRLNEVAAEAAGARRAAADTAL